MHTVFPGGIKYFCKHNTQLEIGIRIHYIYFVTIVLVNSLRIELAN